MNSSSKIAHTTRIFSIAVPTTTIDAPALTIFAAISGEEIPPPTIMGIDINLDTYSIIPLLTCVLPRFLPQDKLISFLNTVRLKHGMQLYLFIHGNRSRPLINSTEVTIPPSRRIYPVGIASSPRSLIIGADITCSPIK